MSGTSRPGENEDDEPLIDLTPPPDDDAPMMFRPLRGKIEGAGASAPQTPASASGPASLRAKFSLPGEDEPKTPKPALEPLPDLPERPRKLQFSRTENDYDVTGDEDLGPVEELFTPPTRRRNPMLLASIVGVAAVALVIANALILTSLPRIEHRTEPQLRRLSPGAENAATLQATAPPQTAANRPVARAPAASAASTTTAAAPRPAPSRAAVPLSPAAPEIRTQPQAAAAPQAEVPTTARVAAASKTSPATGGSTVRAATRAPAGEIAAAQATSTSRSAAASPNAEASSAKAAAAEEAGTASGVFVQFAAVPSTELAESTLSAVQASVPGASAYAQRETKVSVNGASLYRALLGPLPSLAEAKKLCAAAKDAGRDCLIRR